MVHPTQDGKEALPAEWGNPNATELSLFPFSFRRAERRGWSAPIRTLIIRPCNGNVLSFILALSAGATPTADPPPAFGNGNLRERAALTVRAGLTSEYSSAVSNFHWGPAFLLCK